MKSGNFFNIWKTRGLVVSLFVACMVFPARATHTEIWTTDSFEEFSQGEGDHISFTNTGEALLGPQSVSLLNLDKQNHMVWTLAEDSQGNIYAGTGEQGRVFKISPSGETSVFFDSPEIGILSLAVDASDNIYAGSAPDGLIYRLTPTGEQTLWFSTGEHYVWSLVFDATGVLYAGTGEHGKIFKILPDGTGSLLYDSPQSHVMSLVYDSGGWLYAGTEGKGITYKIELDGTVFSLYDAKEEEIRALTLDSQGNLYVAAISSEFFAQPQNQGQIEQPEAPTQEQSSKKSTIYCITPAGTVKKIAEFPEMLIYAMITDRNDELLIGTDEKGRLYRVLPQDRSFHQELTVEKGNIVALLRDFVGNVYLGTSDQGGVMRVVPQLAGEGSYISSVYDAGSTATWGKIFWRGSANLITMFTKTGNTAVPDDTWSAWSEELPNQDGSPIPNPAARFIQWKALFKASQENQELRPELQQVSVAFLPHNLAPEVAEIVVVYPSQADQEQQGNGNSSPASSRKTNGRTPKTDLPIPKNFPAGYLAVVWKAQDPNEEQLEYSISLRGEHETAWKILKEELDTPMYLLDTATLADGAYYVKITVSDAPENPPDRALTTEKISERFEIDNTAPDISLALNQWQDEDMGILLTVIVQDEFSRLQRAEYALDGEEWISIFPDDAVTDSRDEKYSIPLMDLTPEEHLVVFRAIDSHQNVGVAKFVFAPQDAGAPAAPVVEPPQSQPTQ
jgi:sugar lactone lactonase YvrE